MKLRALASLSALAVLGCSAVVGGPIDPGPVACEIVDGVDPCPSGSSCVDFFCTLTYDECNGLDDNGNGLIDEGNETTPPCREEGFRCVSGACIEGCTSEICNGMDDDCDGSTDEELDVDLDMDRVSGCPTNDDPPDCDDSNASVHPNNPTLGIAAAPETCNGLDDDCDPSTGESDLGICGPSAVCQRLPGAASPMCFELTDCRLTGCTSPEVCDTATRACAVPPDDCRGDGQCPAPLICSAATGNCEEPPPAMIGEDCDDGSECASSLCLPRAAMRLPPGDHAGICGAACCSNADCEAGQRCWAPGTGARSCVTAEVYGDASAELCSEPADCSGSCRLGSVTYTAGATTGSFDGMLCMGAVPFGNSQVCDFFGTPVPCSHGACLDNGACANPCGSTADCARQYNVAFTAAYYQPVCDYRLSSGSVITACVAPPTTGTGTTGSACTGNAQCRDGFCVSGQCADVCCSDASCPGSHRCAPIGATIGTDEVWFMLCVPDGTTPE